MAKSNKTNIAKVQDGKILKTRVSKTSGTQNTKGQAFYANTHVNHRASRSDTFEYDAPRYSANTTGTLAFVGQDAKSIFELYGRPEIKMSFSANTGSFTSSTYVNMSHDIFKIPYNELEAYRANPTQENFASIKEKISSPFLSFTATTALTATLFLTGASEYIFSPEQIDKPIRGLSEEIFEDKAAYFFNTRHTFDRTLNAYQNIITPAGNQAFYNRTARFKTAGDVTPIEAGPWSGMNAQGVFFTCFYPPSVPKMEDPKPELFSGETFTPEFFFSNVADGDRYVVDITYQNLNSGFTVASATSKYFYAKEESAVGTQRRATKEQTSFISEDTRRVSVPLIPNSTYYYRVGNIKEVINIFGVRQQIITYTNPVAALSFSGQNVSYVLDSAATKDVPAAPVGGNSTQTGEYQGEVPER